MVGPEIRRLRQRREGELKRKWVTELIDKKRNVSNIELSLTAITVAIAVLKVALNELGDQIRLLIGGGAALQAFDVSVAVGFLTIAFATLQIPKQFTETLIYSNQDALRLLALMGATESFVASCFRRLILRSMIRATIVGLALSGAAYLVICQFLKLWAPSALTSFLLEVETCGIIIIGFMIIVSLIVRAKIHRIFTSYGY